MALLEQPDVTGTSPLMHAAEQGHKDVVVWLLEQGVKPAQEAAKLADGQGHSDIGKLLRKARK